MHVSAKSGAVPGGGATSFFVLPGFERKVQILPFGGPVGVEIRFVQNGTTLASFSATTPEALGVLHGLILCVPDGTGEIETLIQAGPPQATVDYIILRGC